MAKKLDRESPEVLRGVTVTAGDAHRAPMNASVNTSPPPALLTQQEVAKLLGVSRRTLEDWRLTKTGPAFLKLGYRTVRYTADDVRAFIQGARRG